MVPRQGHGKGARPGAPRRKPEPLRMGTLRGEKVCCLSQSNGEERTADSCALEGLGAPMRSFHLHLAASRSGCAGTRLRGATPSVTTVPKSCAVPRSTRPASLVPEACPAEQALGSVGERGEGRGGCALQRPRRSCWRSPRGPSLPVFASLRHACWVAAGHGRSNFGWRCAQGLPGRVWPLRAPPAMPGSGRRLATCRVVR